MKNALIAVALVSVVLIVMSGCKHAPQASVETQIEPQSTARRLTSSILPTRIIVGQGEDVQFEFTIPEEAHDARIDGVYAVYPTPYAQMDVLIVPARLIDNFRDAQPNELPYHSGLIQADSIHLKLQPGTYYFVFDNRAPADETNSFNMPHWQRTVSTKMDVSF